MRFGKIPPLLVRFMEKISDVTSKKKIIFGKFYKRQMQKVFERIFKVREKTSCTKSEKSHIIYGPPLTIFNFRKIFRILLNIFRICEHFSPFGTFFDFFSILQNFSTSSKFFKFFNIFQFHQHFSIFATFLNFFYILQHLSIRLFEICIFRIFYLYEVPV